MRSASSFCLIPLVLGGSLFAQEFTSPAGFLTTEGASNHTYILFSEAEMRWQSIDRSSLGKPQVINNVAWRRDFGAATNTAYGVRTMTNFQFIMGNANFHALQVADLDQNYKGTPTTVIDARTVNAVDWTNKPAASPAPWENALKFDRPFFYTGVDSLLWEVRYTANTSTADYPFDFDAAGGSSDYTSTSGTNVGTACKVTGKTSAISLSLTFYNHETKFRMTRSLTNLPATAPVLLNLDIVDQNLTIPGLCTTVHALPTIMLDLGVSTSTGSLASATIDNIPYVKGLPGATLWFQAWSIDVGQTGLPLVFSAAKKIVVPADPTTSVTRFYHYKVTPTSTLTKSGPWFGGIIAKFAM